MPWNPSCRDSVSRVLGGVGLFRRLRTVESFDFHAFPENAHDRRQARSLNIEKLRPEDLGNQADVSERNLIAVAETAGFTFFREMRFQGLQRIGGPVREPFVARLLVLMHFALVVSSGTRWD